MNLLDFLVIYLACGTPFGMYHFIYHRKSGSHWIKSLLIVFVWFPYAFGLVRMKFSEKFSSDSFQKSNNLETEPELVLEITRKKLEQTFAGSNNSFPIFEFKETIERYIGLTLAIRSKHQKVSEKELNFFKISGNENKKLAAKCLHRRNLKLLSFHHRLARRDFFEFIFKHKDKLSDLENYYHLLFNLVDILQDDEARILIENNFLPDSQSENDTTVTSTENDIWIPELHIQPPEKPITSPLKIISLPTNLPYKD